MNSDIENLNSVLRALILKHREEYVLEALKNIEYCLMEQLSIEEVQNYMENAHKIVFKK